jgi:hypothetical protein
MYVRAAVASKAHCFGAIMIGKTLRLLGAAAAFVLPALPALAQATHTWVANGGNDNGPCTQAAPCSSVQGALGKTANFGKVDIVDSGDYDGFMVTKNIMVQAAEVRPRIYGQITIDAGTTSVFLTGLEVAPSAYSGQTRAGILVRNGFAVHINDCIIRNNLIGLQVVTANVSEVLVTNSLFDENYFSVWLQPVPNNQTVVLDHVRIFGNSAPHKNVTGVYAVGSHSLAIISNSVIMHNEYGLSASQGGNIKSYGNNVIVDNTTDGTPTETAALK